MKEWKSTTNLNQLERFPDPCFTSGKWLLTRPLRSSKLCFYDERGDDWRKTKQSSETSITLMRIQKATHHVYLEKRDSSIFLNVGNFLNSCRVPDTKTKPLFLNRRAAARYQALASIIQGCKRFSWN